MSGVLSWREKQANEIKALNGGRGITKIAYHHNPLGCDVFYEELDSSSVLAQRVYTANIEWKYHVGQLVQLCKVKADTHQPVCALVIDAYWELPNDKEMVFYNIPRHATPEQFERMAKWDRCRKYTIQELGRNDLTSVEEVDIMGVVRGDR